MSLFTYQAYSSVYRCEQCNKRMSYGTKMGSRGTCPFCGKNSGCTIVDCNVSSELTTQPRLWWMFAVPIAIIIIVALIARPT